MVEKRKGQMDALNALKGGSSMSELELVRPGAEKPERVSVLAADGIQARVKYEDPAFVYELRIPYTADKKFPFSIGAHSGTVIGVGLETPDLGGSSGSGGGSPGATGGGRGRGGRGGGASTGSEPDRIQEQAEPLNDWMRVQLLSPDSVRTK